jgi:hypothetical protein
MTFQYIPEIHSHRQPYCIRNISHLRSRGIFTTLRTTHTTQPQSTKRHAMLPKSRTIVFSICAKTAKRKLLPARPLRHTYLPRRPHSTAGFFTPRLHRRGTRSRPRILILRVSSRSYPPVPRKALGRRVRQARTGHHRNTPHAHVRYIRLASTMQPRTNHPRKLRSL